MEDKQENVTVGEIAKALTLVIILTIIMAFGIMAIFEKVSDIIEIKRLERVLEYCIQPENTYTEVCMLEFNFNLPNE